MDIETLFKSSLTILLEVFMIAILILLWHLLVAVVKKLHDIEKKTFIWVNHLAVELGKEKFAERVPVKPEKEVVGILLG